MLKIAKNDPLHLQVYAQLKQTILEGRWKPGEKLVETKIASEFQISRSPIREALRILEYEGMLVKEEQNLLVYKPSLNDIVELYQLRFSLEALSCYLAADVATVEEIDELENILKMTKEALESEDRREVLEWNTKFHEFIIYISKNKHLISVMDGLKAKILYCRNVLIRLDYVRMDNFFQEHMDIFLSIKKGEKEKGKALMEKHINTDLERILKLFPKENLKGGLG